MSDTSNKEDISKELDEPLGDVQDVATEPNIPLSANKNQRDWFNLQKGHNLLGWCVGLIFAIFILDFFFNSKANTIQIIEIFKVMIFTLSGYLYGKKK